MKHETTINNLAAFAGLFSTVDHITVPETNPDTNITEEVTLPPPLIRRTQRRDDTTMWVLTPPGIHERIFVADHAAITVYLKDPTPQQQAPAPQQAAVHQPPAPAPPAPAPPAPAPGGWPQQQPAAPVAYPPQQPAPATPQPATPHRPAAPWTTQQPHN